MDADYMTDTDPDEEEDQYDDIIRAKWLMDGAVTLSEVAAKLRAAARIYEELEAKGWQLTGPVEDDYGFIRQA